jgi:phosphoribosylformylglycinamidine synthase I
VEASYVISAKPINNENLNRPQEGPNKSQRMARIGIVVFPGSNCDRDVHFILNTVLKMPAELVWHTDNKLLGFDSVIIPGGFTYGDRLRAGAIAARTPVAIGLKKMANEGRIILGICNGFQILVECGLLPGALVMNNSLSFVCRWTTIKVYNINTAFTSLFKRNQTIRIPIAHGEGRYVADVQLLKSIIKNNQVVFRYFKDDPNGSVDHIAAVCNKEGNVMGIMPHPERAPVKGFYDEASMIFRSLSAYLQPAK